ncbi:MAG: class I SAM-dependent methyltransferase [Candidatus Polarisedimenticolaceae bacterium]|nr:class I SAM-dependent methyltransferase [Candidatus Polarisedimenticolaceae bacterium]
MSKDSIPWSQLYQARREVQKRYKKIWDVPIAKRYSKVLFDHGHDSSSVLEIGAGSRGLGKRLSEAWPNSTYKSLDIDRTYQHDFYALDEITGGYDIICMFEVIEHVRPEQAWQILRKCKEVLRPGGLFFATTPNIYYPPNYLRDATHITPWCYDELGAIAHMAGFEIQQLYRLYNDSLGGKLVHRVFMYPLHKTMGIDFSKQIMIVASA